MLREAVQTFGAGWVDAALVESGAHVGTAEFQEDARLANAEIPELVSFDHRGNRIDEVRYHPSYHRVIGAATAAGAHTSAWAKPQPGAHVARAATFSLFAQVEPGHACPISMTHAAVPALEHAPELAQTWLPRLFGTEYDGTLRTPGEKPGVLMGMAMTEKQGGSDVRVNETVATRVEGGALLTGHKWFCSAPMSDAFLVLAREGDDPEGRISCFFVPRVLEDGTRNEFRCSGSRSSSSAISRTHRARSSSTEPSRSLSAERPRGCARSSRWSHASGSTASLEPQPACGKAVAEALWHVQHRAAFGRMLIDQPAMTNVVTHLALESEASTLLRDLLAAAHEDAADAQEKSFRRLATAVAKYRVLQAWPRSRL